MPLPEEGVSAQPNGHDATVLSWMAMASSRAVDTNPSATSSANRAGLLWRRDIVDLRSAVASGSWPGDGVNRRRALT